MRIGFLRAYDQESPYQWSLPPLGIGYLAAYAQHETAGHEFIFEPTYERLIEHKPELMAISSASENFCQAQDFAARAKEEMGIPVIAGGMHVTSLPHTLPEVFDAGCIGEGEAVFADLIELFRAVPRPSPGDYAKIKGVAYHDGDGVAISEPAEQAANMDVLPYPDRDLLGRDWAVPLHRQAHMISSRGCPYKCSFCSSGLHWKTYRWFSAEYTVNEIEFLRERYDPQEFYFFDDLFIANSKRFKNICSMLKERGLLDGIHFRCFGRVDLITPEMADRLAEHNFDLIDFGFESNDEKVLQFLNKTHASPEINRRCVDLLAERGISVGGSFIIGCPGEDADALQRTLDFALKNEPYMDRMGFGPLQALPGTAVWDYAADKGIVSEDMDWSRLAVPDRDFDIERFPFLGDKVSKDEFMEWHSKFGAVANRIDMAGQIRALQRKSTEQQAEISRLQKQINSYEGSRVVKAALKLRDLRKRHPNQ